MKLKVKNLGIIKSSEIELKGITVIAGKNQTGKSTLGKILYCLSRTFYAVDNNILDEKERQLLNLLSNEIRQDIRAPRVRYSYSDFDELIEHYAKTGTIKIPVALAGLEDAIKADKELLNKIKTVLDIDPIDVLSTLFLRCLDVEMGGKINPINHPRRKAQISVEFDDGTRLAVSKEHRKSPTIESIAQFEKSVAFIDDPYILDDLSDRGPTRWYLNRFSHRANLDNRLRYDAYNDSVISQILGEKAWKELSTIIFDMCDGELVNSNTVGYQYISPAYKEPLGLESLSTGVKSVLLLKTLLENGSLNYTGVLAFDEPEVHLHPEWQFQFAKILVLLPKVLDIKILLSTHSADFLSAIQYYTKEYDMENITRYYQMKLEGEYSTAEDVTGDIDLIYRDLSYPFLRVADKL